jgi:hypothetical protein
VHTLLAHNVPHVTACVLHTVQTKVTSKGSSHEQTVMHLTLPPHRQLLTHYCANIYPFIFANPRSRFPHYIITHCLWQVYVCGNTVSCTLPFLNFALHIQGKVKR